MFIQSEIAAAYNNEMAMWFAGEMYLAESFYDSIQPRWNGLL